jgi:hypothetical protein
MISLFLSTWLLFTAVSQGFGEDYEALKGLNSVKAVFDVRVANPKSAVLSLKLIHDTCKETKRTSTFSTNTLITGVLR